MPNWYYEKKELRNTPSIQAGLDFETETRYRREGARFIQELGKSLGLRHDTMATGSVYFHRFYMFHSFTEFPRYVTATCALFLAGKAEETPKKCRDIIKTVRSLTNDHQFATFGQDPREEVMTLERVLLQTIKFDLQVDHPYSALIKYAKCLKGDKTKLQKMVQMSWTFVNDSLCTTLSLQWEPEVIAIALMYLAAKLSKFEVKDWKARTPEHKHWWDQYVQFLETDVLEDICHQVLDLYSQPTTAAKEAPMSPLPGSAPPKPTPQPLPASLPSSQTPSQPAPQPQPTPQPAPTTAPRNQSLSAKTSPHKPVASSQPAPAPTGPPQPVTASSYPPSGYSATPHVPPSRGPPSSSVNVPGPTPQPAPVSSYRPTPPPSFPPFQSFPNSMQNGPPPGYPSAGFSNFPPPQGHQGPPPQAHQGPTHQGPPPQGHQAPPPGYGFQHRGPPPDGRGGHLQGPPEGRGGLPPRGPPGDSRGGPTSTRGPPTHDTRVGPASLRGPPPDNRGPPPDNRGGPGTPIRGPPPDFGRGGHDQFRGRQMPPGGSRGGSFQRGGPPPRGSPYSRPPHRGHRGQRY